MVRGADDPHKKGITLGLAPQPLTKQYYFQAVQIEIWIVGKRMYFCLPAFPLTLGMPCHPNVLVIPLHIILRDVSVLSRVESFEMRTEVSYET